MYKNFLRTVISGRALTVILGFIPRIHEKQSLSRHYRACPDNLDPRDKPEDDNRKMMYLKPEDDKNNDVSTSILTVILGFIPRIHAKHHALCRHYRACPDNLDTRDRLFVTPEDDYKVMQCGRSMIEMLGVLAIVGVLSVGGIAGYSKAMMKFKINKTIEQMSMILANTRILYSSQGNYSGLYGSGTYIEGIKPIIGETDEFLSPFGGYNWLETGSSHNDMFHLTFSALPKEACMELATLNWGTEQSSGIVGLGIGIGFVSWVAFNNYDDCINSSTSEHIVENSTYEILYTACKTKLPISPATAANYCNICAEAGDCGITLFSK